MITYTFTATIGQDQHGADVVKEFVIEAENFAEARHQLTELVAAEQRGNSAPN